MAGRRAEDAGVKNNLTENRKTDMIKMVQNVAYGEAGLLPLHVEHVGMKRRYNCMKKIRISAKVLALALALMTVFSVAGVRPAVAESTDPVIYLYSGAGTYMVGETITLVYRYSPKFVNYEYTYCELYNAYGTKVAGTYHAWNNQTSTAYRNWTVKLNTEKLALEAGTYTVKAYVYRLGTVYSEVYSYLTLEQIAPVITLSKTSYEYEVPFTATKIYRSFKLKATVSGSTEKVTWSSSDPTVATVASNGRVKVIGVGYATITATVNGANAYCFITVTMQTAYDYYEQRLEPYVDIIEEQTETTWSNRSQLKKMVIKVYSAAKKLNTYINKAPGLKSDATLANYMATFMKNVKTAYSVRNSASKAYLLNAQTVFNQNIQYIDARLEKLVGEDD